MREGGEWCLTPPTPHAKTRSRSGFDYLAAMPRVRSNRRVLLLGFALVSTAMAVGLAELTLRMLTPATPERIGELSYADETGKPMDLAEAVANGRIVDVPPPVTEFTTDRHRRMVRANQDFFLCYSHAHLLKKDWMDAEGRVPVHINQYGLRERDSITEEKPSSQKRVLCIGDSFTFGWGVPVEAGWVRRLENDLRTEGKDIRTVNCGWAGTVCIDEYVTALRHRFHPMGPDAVILTICLNDLIPNSGLSFMDPVPETGFRLLDRARAAFGRTAYDLDPRRDWVSELLALPSDQAVAAQYAQEDRPADSFWSAGTPQKALRGGRDWCAERKIPFLVVIWPFLQGLGPGRHYPFTKLHGLVADFCKAEGIPFHDVTASLQGTPQEDLWVTPNDLHANPLAHQLATPGITAFVRAHTQW